MFLALRDLEQQPIRFKQVLPPGTIRFDSDFEQVGPLIANGFAELHSATEEIRVAGHIQVTLQFHCDRCLEPFQDELNEDFDLTYVPASDELGGTEVAIKTSESTLDFYEGTGLELNDILQEQVLLAVPLQRLCRADCKGICALCGQNRNNTTCDCQTEMVDERWSALRNLQ